jgi:Tol biopolymer transport system component
VVALGVAVLGKEPSGRTGCRTDAWPERSFSPPSPACCSSLSRAPRARDSKDAGLIVYWSESPWPSIWSIRLDGSHRRRILLSRQNGKRPRLSPDRRWVAFDGAPPGKPALSDFDIQVVRLDGTGLRTVTRSSQWDVDAQWSPDGTLLSFSRLPPHAADEHSAFVWIVNRNGSGLRRLAHGFGARWSPDGAKLVYEASTAGSASDLSVIGADGGNPRPLLTTAGIEQPAGWSPDGTSILFTRYDASNRAAVFVTSADGRNVRRVAAGIAGAWSPDGSRILYSAGFFTPLLVMDADGSHRHAVTRFAASEPDWR